MAPSRKKQQSLSQSRSTLTLTSLDTKLDNPTTNPAPLNPPSPPAKPRASTDNDNPSGSAESLASNSDHSLESDDADFRSHYSLNPQSTASTASSSSEEDEDDVKGAPDNIADSASTASAIASKSFLTRSQSALAFSNAFAPPFYNRPPTPLPPSPSLTSLLRPSFSAHNSRPTTPDSSENDTPNDTEAVVAKSARTATTVPRASPKVPTYEYYGFVLYVGSGMIFRAFLHLMKLPHKTNPPRNTSLQ